MTTLHCCLLTGVACASIREGHCRCLKDECELGEVLKP